MSNAKTQSSASQQAPSHGLACVRIVALLMLLVAIGHFNRVGMSVAGAERIMGQYELSPTEMGKIYSAFLLCYTLAMLPGGWLLDRWGPRRMLMAFAFASATFVALTGCVGLAFRESHAVWLGLMVVRGCLGAVNAPLHPSAARMVFEHAPPAARSLANGMVTMAASLGIAGTYYGVGELIDWLDWPGTFLVCGALTLAAAGVWTVAARAKAEAPSPRGAATESPVDAGAMWRALASRGVVFVTLSYTAQGYFQYLFFYWIEYYFETIQKQGVDVARQYSTLIVLMMGAGMVLGGWLTDRASGWFSSRGRRRLVPAVGMLASGVIFELGLLSPDPRITLAAFTLSAAFLGTCEGAFWTTIVELGGRFGGAAGGLMNTGGNIGGTLSPYLTPLLGGYFTLHFGDDRGWRLSLAVAGAVAILGALLWGGVEPRPEADEGRRV